MKGVSVASALVAAFGFIGTASAADFSYPMPPPEEFSWAGPYVGINGGYGGDRFEYPFSFDVDCCRYDPDPITGQFDITSSGFVYGAQAGYNFLLTPNVLLGIEGDIQGTSIKGNLGFHLDPSFDVNAGSKVDWFGTIRGRLGWVDGKFLVYATGGWATGKTTAYANSSWGLDLSKSAKLNGYAVGGGAEYAINNHWTLKTEYLYVNLGKNNLLSYTGGYEKCDIAFDLDQKTHFHVVRAGLNYKF